MQESFLSVTEFV